MSEGLELRPTTCTSDFVHMSETDINVCKQNSSLYMLRLMHWPLFILMNHFEQKRNIKQSCVTMPCAVQRSSLENVFSICRINV